MIKEVYACVVFSVGQWNRGGRYKIEVMCIGVVVVDDGFMADFKCLCHLLTLSCSMKSACKAEPCGLNWSNNAQTIIGQDCCSLLLATMVKKA